MRAQRHRISEIDVLSNSLGPPSCLCINPVLTFKDSGKETTRIGSHDSLKWESSKPPMVGARAVRGKIVGDRAYIAIDLAPDGVPGAYETAFFVGTISTLKAKIILTKDGMSYVGPINVDIEPVAGTARAQDGLRPHADAVRGPDAPEPEPQRLGGEGLVGHEVYLFPHKFPERARVTC